MAKIKKYLSLIVSIVVIAVIVLNFDKITTRIQDYLYTIKNDRNIIIQPDNEYKRNYKYLYVQNNEDFIPHSYNDLVNIVYSVLNNGWTEFTFYCPSDYEDCLDDIKKLSNDNEQLSTINNFVNPYNSYSTIKTIYDDTGVITFEVNHLYNQEEIKKTNNTIDEMIEKNINNNMTDKQKIKAIHDYIIDNTIYDVVRAEKKESQYDSARITGVLYEHYGTCSGYSDLMAIVLDKLNIPNYKITTDNHVWNAVYIDGTWKHLDVTWDDPVLTSGKQTLEYTFFLVNTNTLLEKDKKDQHKFNPNIYLEFKKEA